jgi:hypothetical protein
VKHAIPLLIVTLWCHSLRLPAYSGEIPSPVARILAKHCLGCHDDATKEGGFSLAALEPDFGQPAWVRVHDKIARGQMPPAGQDRPEPAEIRQVTDWLSQELIRTTLAGRATDGRTSLRRMNRREYETTLHDLLGIALPLRDILPEDTLIHGFDTLARGLDTSSSHLLSYQRAADRAIAEALPTFPVASVTKRHTGRAYLESRLPVHRTTGIDPFVRVDGDSLIYHATVGGDMAMQAPHPPIPGRYRIRAAVRPVNNGDRPMTVFVGKRVDRFQAEKLLHVIDYFDIPAGKTTVIEVETDLKYSQGNQFIFFEALGLPRTDELAKQRGADGGKPLPADFADPGLATEWAELEGPLDIELGVQRMFGDLPREPRMPEGRSLPENWRSWPVPGEFTKYPLTARSEAPAQDAERLIRNFLKLAFRRPPTEQQVADHVAVVKEYLDQGDDFDEAMRGGYKAILCSSNFLYYIEPPGKLDDYSIAARLSRLLWSSMPDEALFAAAGRGELSTANGLRAQTERMLGDRKAERFIRTFTDQWLNLAGFLDMAPDGIYVEYDAMLAWSLPQETRAFFREMLEKDLPAASVVQTDWTYLNERLAQHYGLPPVQGTQLRRTALAPGSLRGGLITHGSILKMTTNASYTSPVKRGAWILERIVGLPPDPPPPDVAAVEPDIRGASTIREQLDKHKTVAVCAQCHRHIDPPGFALENFDVLGGWRERYRVKQGGQDIDSVELANYPGRRVFLAKAVDASGETEDGKSFANIDEFKSLLLRDADQLARNLAEKLILYATGAEIDFADRVVIEQIVRDTKSTKHGLRSLLHAVVQSPLFLEK